MFPEHGLQYVQVFKIKTNRTGAIDRHVTRTHGALQQIK
uniref:Uncharacterized protein n=1 Tax=Anguilla anguilla TaxID=7936 RepID=A0A0E9VM90_ANGAN